MARREGIPVKVWLDEATLALLKAHCRRRGVDLLPDCIAALIREALESGGQAPEAYDRLVKRLERAVQDILNPFTGKIDEINRRLAELVEALEAGEEREAPQPPAHARPGPAGYAGERAERPARKSTAIERLKEEGVVFEEDMRWMKSPTRFFQKLEREGAIVLEVHGEKVAIDPEFWREFREAISEIQISDLTEAASAIEEKLGTNAGRLFRRLARAGMIYFNEESGAWEVSESLREGG